MSRIEKQLKEANWWYASNDEEVKRVECEIQTSYEKPPRQKRVRYLLSDEEIQMREQVDDDECQMGDFTADFGAICLLCKHSLSKRFRTSEDVPEDVKRYGLWR